MFQNNQARSSHRWQLDKKGFRHRLCRGAVIMAVGLLLVACASPNPSGTIDKQKVRQERYLVSELKLPSSFAEIQQSLFQHRAACNIYFNLEPDPQQVHYATLTYGLSPDGNVEDSILADLRATSAGNVHISTYAYYAQNRDLAYALATALSDPQHCPRSDS